MFDQEDHEEIDIAEAAAEQDAHSGSMAEEAERAEEAAEHRAEQRAEREDQAGDQPVR